MNQALQHQALELPAALPLLDLLDSYADQGLLSRLSSAFARFMGTLGMTAPAQTVACAVLSELERRGHSCLRLDFLADDPAALLEWNATQWQDLCAASGTLPESLAAWRVALTSAAQVLQAGAEDGQQPLVLDGDRLYLRRYWRDESLVARALIERAAQARVVDTAAARNWLGKLFDQAPSASEQNDDTDWQKIACAIALRSGVSIITGGPGTGKTYTVARLLALLFAMSSQPQQLRVALAAPTGKAAARLKQAIDGALQELDQRVGAALPLAALAERIGSARTLHSLLGARGDTRSFIHHAGHPLEVDVLIVDEASMVHLEMMAALLAALPVGAMLILLGDKDQLASVEAGAVLGDLCRDAEAGGYDANTVAYLEASCGEQPGSEFLGDAGTLAQQTVMLRQVRRFSEPIGALALAVNRGDAVAATACLRDDSTGALFWLEQAQQRDVLDLVLQGRAGATGGYRAYLELLAQRPVDVSQADYEAWAKTLLLAFDTFRILCAVREGDWGVAGLNLAIEKELDSVGLIAKRGEWYAGRPVMVGRNDSGTGVYNGDIGVALPDPLRPQALRVYFLDGESVRSVLATRLRYVATAYALTVHKAQGSEFRHTVLVLPSVSTPVLTRELVYTGITRARAGFTLVSPQSAMLEEAIRRRTERASGLRELLNAAATGSR
ncbi:exodeoxyribonuclease V subunit alpha [Herbaspirillum sp. RTI4]|uniref:exodeoxyribonuclease V subunit alpha n=1 Tax=Herbaspirillum sp. RTI4 TaxID=3048640 RepID=UPI002AB5C2DA|nr:exodeoxyribonuclease V subunit alpha [Herbaspirillum sp. RTI4]MDY7577381.1 exodeoxyribonuclease V subunit alpha [Herbaspirillum sp. RTI4]MEA9982391.1 exodeoxyribonuclease V subunit alpha [Herbaspirillum sp. RTI4]